MTKWENQPNLSKKICILEYLVKGSIFQKVSKKMVNLKTETRTKVGGKEREWNKSYKNSNAQ